MNARLHDVVATGEMRDFRGGTGVAPHARVMKRIVMALMLVGCGWDHAPGYAGKEAMEKTELPSVQGQLCTDGVCDLHGPTGIVAIHHADATVVNGDRRETKFQIDYQGKTASCFGPARGSTSDKMVPLACKIGTSLLAIDAGCTTGSFSESAMRTFPIQTDTAKVLGKRMYGREVTMMDGLGVLAMADSPNAWDRVLYTRPSTYITTEQMLALLAVEVFVNMSGTPAECVN